MSDLPGVHLIAIGAELLSGDRLETNAHELQRMLLDAGFVTARDVVVGDDVEEIAAVVKTAAVEADVVIATGGLGPTVDDMTREAVASAAGVGLREDPRALADIEGFFEKLGREMKSSNRRQALVPEGGEVLPNPIGTAPAFRIDLEGTPVYCLPGVPQEMRVLMKEAVLPLLKKEFSNRVAVFARAKVHVMGLTESSANDRIKDLLEAADPRAGITVENSVITVSLVSDSAEKVERARQQVLKAFGNRIIGEDGDRRIEQVVGKLLIEQGITLALAESCTGGYVGHLMTSVPGISEVFLEGAVTYSGEAKTRTLGVSGSLMEEHGQVSAEVARAMAEGAARRAGARAALGITGIAGPGGGTPEKPVGRVHMAAFFDGKVRDRMYTFTGDRKMVKLRSGHLALDLLRRTILGLE